MMETDSYKLIGRSVVFCLPRDSRRKSGDSLMLQICLWTLISSMVGWSRCSTSRGCPCRRRPAWNAPHLVVLEVDHHGLTGGEAVHQLDVSAVLFADEGPDHGTRLSVLHTPSQNTDKYEKYCIQRCSWWRVGWETQTQWRTPLHELFSGNINLIVCVRVNETFLPLTNSVNSTLCHVRIRRHYGCTMFDHSYFSLPFLLYEIWNLEQL